MPTSRAAPGFRGLSHLTPSGDARMVDVSPKKETAREAVARVVLKMLPATLGKIRAGQIAKGDVLGVARTAGIMAAKRTPDLIPLCHPLRTRSATRLHPRRQAPTVTIEARVPDVARCASRGGVTARPSPARLRHGQAVDRGSSVGDCACSRNPRQRGLARGSRKTRVHSRVAALRLRPDHPLHGRRAGRGGSWKPTAHVRSQAKG